MCVYICADGRALAVGGMGADLLPRSILQQYDLRKDVWALLPSMPTPRYDANINLIGNKLYVAGTTPSVATVLSLCVLNNSLLFFFVLHFQSTVNKNLNSFILHVFPKS